MVTAVDDTTYRSLFEHAPVATFLEDFTDVAEWMSRLRAAGVSDLRRHLSADLLDEARSLVRVLEVNETAVEMFGEEVRQTLVAGLELESNEERAAFTEQLMALWEGRDRIDIEFPSLSSPSGSMDCHLSWSVRRDSGGTVDPSHVVVTIADTSEQRAVGRQVAKRAEQLQLLHDVSIQVAGLRSLDDVLRLIVEGTVEVLSAGQARLIILDEDRMEIAANVGAGADDEAHLDPITVAGVVDGIAGWVLETGEPTLSADIGADERNRGDARDAARASVFGPLAVAPLMVNARVVGTLAALRLRDDPIFLSDDLHMLTTLATHAGYAIQTGQLLSQLEGSLAARDRLLAQVSHELRTPLTAVIGMAGTMRDNAHRLGPEELSRYAGVIVEQGNDLAQLVEQLLSTAAAEAGALDIGVAPVDLWQQAATVAASLGLTATTGSEPVEVTADALRVRQIVRNLISNARRHGGPSIRVEVSRSDEFGVVEVSDDGEGVPTDVQPTLFEPFEHGQHHAESIGLGLAVSLDLARRMNGDLTYRRHDGWSTFRLTLPRSDQAA